MFPMVAALGIPAVKLPFVARSLYEQQCSATDDVRATLAVCNDWRLAALADLAVATADVHSLRQEVITLTAAAAKEAARAEAQLERVEEYRRLVEQYREFLAGADHRYAELLAQHHATTGRVADLADLAIRPAPPSAVALQPTPDFQSFPPIVASALAIANAGFTKDVQRANYIWAESELTRGEKPDVVAHQLRFGRPVNVDAEDPA